MRIEQVFNRNFHLATGIIFVKSDLRKFFKSEFTKFPSKLEIVAAISDLLLLDIRLFSSLYFVVTYTGSSTFKPRITLSKIGSSNLLPGLLCLTKSCLTPQSLTTHGSCIHLVADPDNLKLVNAHARLELAHLGPCLYPLD